MRDPFDEYDEDEYGDDYFDSGERLRYTPELYEDLEAETRIPGSGCVFESPGGSRLRISRGICKAESA
jgi:hypothetical protein